MEAGSLSSATEKQSSRAPQWQRVRAGGGGSASSSLGRRPSAGLAQQPGCPWSSAAGWQVHSEYISEIPRPELKASPEIFYNESEARKYTTSHIIKIQARISETALELLALPNDGVPKMLLDIGCGSGVSGDTLTENGHHWIGCDISKSMVDVALEQETESDLLLADMGEALHYDEETELDQGRDTELHYDVYL